MDGTLGSRFAHIIMSTAVTTAHDHMRDGCVTVQTRLKESVNGALVGVGLKTAQKTSRFGRFRIFGRRGQTAYPIIII